MSRWTPLPGSRIARALVRIPLIRERKDCAISRTSFQRDPEESGDARRETMSKKRMLCMIIMECICLAAICLAGFGLYLSYKRMPTSAGRSAAGNTGTEAEYASGTAVVSEEEYRSVMPDMHYTNIILVGLDVRDQTRMDYANSDTMILANINNDTGDVRLVSLYRDTLVNVESPEGTPELDIFRPADGEDDGARSAGLQAATTDEALAALGTSAAGIGRYDKINSAYMYGSSPRMIRMLEDNLEIKVDGYVIVNFTSVADTIDDLGGIDVWMTKQEVIHMNNYCVETSAATGKEYVPIEPEEEAREYHLNGVQAVSYARIRYTAGNDMKRTQRQRVVIHKITELAKSEPASALKAIVSHILPNVRTDIPVDDILSYAINLQYYRIDRTTGFPFAHIERHCSPNGREIDPVVPVTLAENVKELHKFLFDDEGYEPGVIVRIFSRGITEITGLGEADIEAAVSNSVIRDSGGEADVVR